MATAPIAPHFASAAPSRPFHLHVSDAADRNAGSARCRGALGPLALRMSAHGNRFLACCLLAIAATVTPSYAIQIYKGDGTPGGLVPDFPQDCGQTVKGICAAAAVTDSLWYFDQHGYAGLVKHKDPSKPNDSWKEDSKALVIDLARRIYGKDYMDGKTDSTRGGRGVEGAIQDYLTEKKTYNSQKTDGTGLTVKYFDGSKKDKATKATYDNWQSELERSEDVIGNFLWRNADNTPVKVADPKDPKKSGEIRHAMTGGGWDTEKKKLKVSNPWGDHPADKPPYDKSYFSEYDITIGADGRVKIPKKAGVDLFGYDADHVSLEGFWAVSPGQSTRVRDSVRPGSPGMNEYSYQVENMTFDPIFQFALEVQVPFSLASVSAPAGWQFTFWDPALTPDVTPSAPQLTEPGTPLDPGFSDWDPTIEGILWYTFTDPLLSASLLDGFAFEVSNVFRHGEFAALAALSDGLSLHVDPDSPNLLTEFAVTSGPLRMPEPPILLLFGVGSLGFMRLRRPVH